DGTFTVDANTGVVRTAQKHYTPGETYRVSVQACGKTPTNRNLSEDSEIAVLEIYAGDRAPYVTSHGVGDRYKELNREFGGNASME
ncbi:unnamed protein product, partial [Toxocara canis]|uniref:Fibronectin type-III domain-containing protein n=1 Tax=Toxocara canis TaxID=6265 RepID=A0A183VC09_TOXCA